MKRRMNEQHNKLKNIPITCRHSVTGRLLESGAGNCDGGRGLARCERRPGQSWLRSGDVVEGRNGKLSGYRVEGRVLHRRSRILQRRGRRDAGCVSDEICILLKVLLPLLTLYGEKFCCMLLEALGREFGHRRFGSPAGQIRVWITKWSGVWCCWMIVRSAERNKNNAVILCFKWSATKLVHTQISPCRRQLVNVFHKFIDQNKIKFQNKYQLGTNRVGLGERVVNRQIAQLQISQVNKLVHLDFQYKIIIHK